MHIQMKAFAKQAADQCRSCVSCASPDVFSVVVIPLGQAQGGIAVAAVGFCESCMANLNKETLAECALDRINADRGEMPEIPIIDDQGKITGFILQDGEIKTLQ